MAMTAAGNGGCTKGTSVSKGPSMRTPETPLWSPEEGGRATQRRHWQTTVTPLSPSTDTPSRTFTVVAACERRNRSRATVAGGKPVVRVYRCWLPTPAPVARLRDLSFGGGPQE